MTTKGNVFLTGLILGALLSFVLANASEHTAADPPEQTMGFKISGTDYHPKGSNFRIGYVIGSLDAFLLSAHLRGTGKAVYDFTSCMDNWTKHELIVIVERYMHENPTEWHHSAALLSHNALKEKCQNQSSPVN